MHPIIRLVNRNLTVSLNPEFLIWQLIFPLIYIFVAGFAYTSIIDQVIIENKVLDYPSFLATGMIGFNIMNSTLISGMIIWNDRRHGMFEQIMSGPFTRLHYILANIMTIGTIGIISASLTTGIGFLLFSDFAEFSLTTIPMIVFASIFGAILFGSIASIVSTKISSSEGFNVITNTLFFFFAFTSTTFYPVSKAHDLLSMAFYLNPLTYIVDIIRASIFGVFSELVIIEMILLVITAIGFFALATKLLTKLDF
jgi:ABC-2 type transport system permease protein